MKSAFFVCLAALAIGLCSCTEKKTADTNSTAPAKSTVSEPVLVELFTSEGCGNCPPADKQLAFLEAKQPITGADVVTLGYHVDYFNDRGWKDEYSSPEYTKRQKLYSMRLGDDSMYTPQMIVDGKTQFVGSDAAKANKTIADAASVAKADVNATVNERTVEVSITDFGPHTVGTVVLASAEDGLVSDVKAGNNSGKKLSHVSVVRKLQAFGKVPERAAEFKGTVELPSDPAWNQENMRYIIYVQEDMSGKIIAVGRIKP